MIDLEVGRRPKVRAGRRQPVFSEGQGAAVVLVADEGHVVTEHIPPVEVRAVQGPMVGPIDGVATLPAGGAQAQAVIAAEDEAEAGDLRLRAGEHGMRPQVGRLGGRDILGGLALPLVADQGAPVVLPAHLPEGGVAGQDGQPSAAVDEPLQPIDPPSSSRGGLVKSTAVVSRSAWRLGKRRSRQGGNAAPARRYHRPSRSGIASG